ncbi:MAG: STAS domain-containing protein [Clostridia bacterium]|nr:STAS domain-containing protein [Clostridia bacterium]MBR4726294.1 STAS domain-containing protein [Clostridia bacterium]
MLNFEKKIDGSVLTVLLDGKLDTGTTPELAAAIEADTEQADQVIFDMKDLKYISSAGLRLLLSLHKKMMKKDGFVIRNVNETNMEILDFTGFAEILNIE